MIGLREIVRAEGLRYMETHHLGPVQRKALHDIAQCRTAAMGVTPQICDDCRQEYRLFCSCRNRSCPLCGGEPRRKWLEAREEELLPGPYLHIVFTVPSELRVLARYCPKELYSAAMRAAGKAVIDVGRSKLHLELGCRVHLHTWTQQMLPHLHMHCMVPAGGFSENKRWVSFEPKDLPAEALKKRFRARLCRALRQAARKGKFDGLPPTVQIEQLLATVKARRWKVYAKPPFKGPEHLLGYLSQYMYRVAITNDRIESYQEHEVTFRCRAEAGGCEQTRCTLGGQEFLDRFLLHIPPKGFVAVRSYGFLGNRDHKRNIERAHELIGKREPIPRERFKPLRLCLECAASRGFHRTHYAPDPEVEPQLDLSLRPPPIASFAA